MKKRARPLLQSEDIAQRRATRPRDPAQPSLPLDPMPDRVKPCLALLKTRPPKGPAWAYEVKWDGYRLAVHIRNGKFKIITRGGHDWTERFPAIAKAAAALSVHTAILDGEAVVLDDRGRSEFGTLQRSLGGVVAKRRPMKRSYTLSICFISTDMI